MRFKKLKSLILVVLIFMLAFSSVMTTYVSAAGKETPKRAIAIVYDNSGSMFMKDNKAWCQALYAVEVFASMMNQGDKLMLYPMNPIGPEDGSEIYTREKPLSFTYESDKGVIGTLRSYLDEEDDTPIEAIDFANEGLKGEIADQKWLVVLTDGAEFYENENALGEAKTKSALEERFGNYISDSNILYLGIGVKESLIPSIKATGNNFYGAKSAKSENVPTVLTEMCNNIFGRDALKGKFVKSGEKKINFDIPLSKLYVFIQGNEIDNVQLFKDGKPLTAIQTYSPSYNNSGCEYKYVKNAAVDDSLKGCIAVYSDLEKGTYTYSCDGTVRSTAFYYEVDADLQLCFVNGDGAVITSAEEVAPGIYDIEYALVDKKGNILKSELLGNIDFKLGYTLNGEKFKAQSNKSEGKLQVELDEKSVFKLDSVEVNFLSGYKIRKTGGMLDFLFKELKPTKGAAKLFNIKISGGAKDSDQDLVSDVPPYVVSLVYDGRELTDEEMANVKLKTAITGSGISLDVKQINSGYELRLVPDKNLPVAPAGDYIINVDATISSKTVKDSAASAKARITVKEVHDEMSLDLAYSSTTFSTIDKKAPEILAKIKYNGEKLTPEQFEALDFDVTSPGLEMIITPLPEDSAYLIKPDTEADVTPGEFPVNISASGIKARNGEQLHSEGGLKIKVQLLPLWIIILIAAIILALLALIIWLWARTPVLPKVIDFDPSTVRISVDGTKLNVVQLTVAYPKKGRSRSIQINANGALNGVYIQAKLIPAKDSYRYLPSKKRKALVVNNGVNCPISAPNTVNNVFLGNAKFVKGDGGPLAMKPPSTANFTFPKGNIIISGTKSVFGRMSEFSISGTIVFKDKR